MKRLWGAAVGAALLASACKIERTPPEYIDHQNRVAAENEAAAAELRDRLLALGQAVARGNTLEATIALAAAEEATIVTPADGVVLTGSEQIAEAIRRVTGTPVAVEIRNVRVSVAPRGNTAWFQAEVVVPAARPGGETVRFTGVYLRREGAWQLVQAHLSTPRAGASPGGSSPDSAAAPPEDG